MFDNPFGLVSVRPFNDSGQKSDFSNVKHRIEPTKFRFEVFKHTCSRERCVDCAFCIVYVDTAA